jgi:hypothetical protein
MTDNMSSSVARSAIGQLDFLVGRWNWRGRSSLDDFSVTGWAEFEWLDGRHFLIERSQLTAAGGTNTNIVVIAGDDDGSGCTAHYFDSDGRQASYQISVDDGRLNIAWDRYRFSGTISPDARSVVGPWAKSEDGSTWRYWYDLTMTKD